MCLDELMKKVIEVDFIEKDLKTKRSSSITVRTCPWCQGPWKLNINADKGVYRCAKCGEAGNAVKLHSKLRNLSYEEAKAELLGETLEPKCSFEVHSQEELELASLTRRSHIYKAIIRNGYPSKGQAQDLLKRGLTSKQFSWYAACSEAMKNDFAIWCKKEPKALIENGKIVGVPGLYGKVKRDQYGIEITDELYLNMPKEHGYFIPVITHGYKDRQEISCLQVRHLKGELRYSFFTSGHDDLKNGCSVSQCNKIHYTRNFWDNGKLVVPKVVNLTEGALKADVASVLSGEQFIAILGVNNTRDLLEELKFLKERGCETINVCLDMDYIDNPHVSKALKNINKIILKADLVPRKVTWDKNFKGIDDYLLHIKKERKNEVC